MIKRRAMQAARESAGRTPMAALTLRFGSIVAAMACASRRRCARGPDAADRGRKLTDAQKKAAEAFAKGAAMRCAGRSCRSSAARSDAARQNRWAIYLRFKSTLGPRLNEMGS